MSRERGAKNILKFNSDRMERNTSLIEEELGRCKKSKLIFMSVGALATYLQNATSIHRTTLIRNRRHQVLLANYMALQAHLSPGMSEHDKAVLTLKAELLASSVEISNLRSHIQRLEAYFQRAGQAIPEAKAQASRESQGDYQAFGDTAMVLIAILDRFKESVSVDFANRTILDMAAMPSQRVISGPNRTGAFFIWLVQNKHVLFGDVILTTKKTDSKI
jgi:hypothetical protein